MEATDPLGGASLLIIMPGEYGIRDAFVSNLKHHGSRYRVVSCNYYPCRMNFGQKVLRAFRKMIGDSGYRKRFQKQNDMVKMLEHIGTDTFDYVLCIRPDLLTFEALDRIKSRARRCFAYTWDGLSRFDGTLERRKYFEKLHVFDPKDAKPEEGMPVLGNFYFDCYPELLPKLNLQAADVYFIGSYDSRWPIVEKICNEMIAAGLKPDVQQFASRHRDHVNLPAYAKAFYSHKPYVQALAEAVRCRAILDIHHVAVHNGFSFRVFEAIGYGLKLVTTNSLVLDQDFYRSANIYCLGNDARTLADFIAEPLEPLPEAVRLRYGFKAWIRRALDLPALH